ncbi:MAG: hypothetical protein Q8P67_06860 [archaeon]|nr:hypothetical protein [archaeon]
MLSKAEASNAFSPPSLFCSLHLWSTSQAGQQGSTDPLCPGFTLGQRSSQPMEERGLRLHPGWIWPTIRRGPNLVEFLLLGREEDILERKKKRKRWQQQAWRMMTG